MTPVNSFLEGLRVVDLSFNFPGPLATKLLADLGADVVKIEPTGGEPLKHTSPSAYRLLNEAKRVIELDLKSSDGRATAEELFRDVDIVVEGFRPGVADRLGVGFARVAELAPKVTYCSISGYGQTGGAQNLPGHSMCYEARGGAMHPAVVAHERPTPPVLPTADVASSLFAALVACAALRGEREARHVDISMQDVSVFLSFTRWGEFYSTGEDGDASQFGHFNPGYGIYETADGAFIVLAAVEEKFWVAVCDSLGMPELAAPPYDKFANRLADRADIAQRVSAAISSYTRDQLHELFGRSDIPIADVRSASAVAADQDLCDSGLIQHRDDRIRVGFPVRLNGVRPDALERQRAT